MARDVIAQALYAREYYKDHKEDNKERKALNHKLYYENNKEHCLNKFKENRLARKIKCLNAYGGCMCDCCLETEVVFLTLDHMGGGGNKHRKSLGNNGYFLGGDGFYRWLINNNFPDGFRVLCYNCNNAIKYNNNCSHKNKIVRY